MLVEYFGIFEILIPWFDLHPIYIGSKPKSLKGLFQVDPGAVSMIIEHNPDARVFIQLWYVILTKCAYLSKNVHSVNMSIRTISWLQAFHWSNFGIGFHSIRYTNSNRISSISNFDTIGLFHVHVFFLFWVGNILCRFTGHSFTDNLSVLLPNIFLSDCQNVYL